MSEDLKPSGDITTELIKNNKKIKAKNYLKIKNCVVGGLNFCKKRLFKIFQIKKLFLKQK